MTQSATETELFVATTRAFLDRHATLAQQRALHAEDREVDAAWWRQAAELGWTGLLVPEDLGGGSVSASGLHDLAAIAEQIGHTVAPAAEGGVIDRCGHWAAEERPDFVARLAADLAEAS